MQAVYNNIGQWQTESAIGHSDASTDSDSVESADVTYSAPISDHIPAAETGFSRLALKTNMLYYAALMPNLELEWLIARQWSVAVEGNLAWWGSYKRDRSYRVAMFDGELRRWIKPRKPWHGLYVGILAGGGYYDIDKDSPGHYGWGMMGGLTCGYMWPIGHHFSLEAEIGAGYARLRSKEYEPVDGHHVYLRTKDINYFGPVKLKLSIAWRFLNAPKPHKANSAI